MNKIKALICLLIPLLLIYALNSKFGDLPPVLRFLDPYKGFWQNAESTTLTADKTIKLPNTISDVDVVFDSK
jgi:penicillin amidase